MSQMFVRGIAELAEAYVSVKRLEKFLKSDEIDQKVKAKDEMLGVDDVAISVSNLRANWITVEKDSKVEPVQGTLEKENLLSQRYTLDQINLNVKKESLVGIIGAVGSGILTSYSKAYSLQGFDFRQKFISSSVAK